MKKKSETVAVLGASDNPERYSNRAVRLLLEHGHHPIPVNPRLEKVEDLPVAPSLGDIEEPVDTLTLYLSPERLEPLRDDILALKPGRVIFNPGTETPALASALTEAGIPCEEACTLVLLNTGQF